MLLELLRLALLALHLLANAVAGGGPLAACLLPLPSEIRRRIAWVSVWALALGLVTGALATLLVLAGGDQPYQAAAARLPAWAYGMLVIEWIFTAGLCVGLALLWDRVSRRPFWLGLIGLIAATNLLYHFPTTMIALAQLADNPDLAGEQVVTRPVFRQLMLSPDVLWRTLHYWSLSLLATGLMVMTVDASVSRTGAVVSMAGVGGLFLSGAAVLFQSTTTPAWGLTWADPSGWLLLCGALCGALLITVLCLEAAGQQTRKNAPVWIAMAALLMMIATARS